MRGGLILGAFAFFAAVDAFAVRHVGFEIDSFNRAYPASYARSFVFSPVAFELDCVLIAESLDTIPKANVSSTMGVLIDFPSAYGPVIQALDDRTNCLAVISARGFCVSDIALASPTFRTHIQSEYHSEVMRLLPKEGAEAWFKAMLDGEMEDFEISADAARSRRYSFYDLVSVSAAWEEPFPLENTRPVQFFPNGDTNGVEVVCMSDVRVAELLEEKEYSILRLPLKGGAFFFAVLPREGFSLDSAKSDMTSMEIEGVIASFGSGSSSDMRRYSGPCSIVLPRMELSSRTDLLGMLGYFRVPTSGLKHVAADSSAGEIVQYAKFSLVEHGRGEKTLVRKGDDEVIPESSAAKKAIFNRPFIFFIYHEATATILVAGQFTGNMPLAFGKHPESNSK